jgi:hypothetical protein
MNTPADIETKSDGTQVTRITSCMYVYIAPFSWFRHGACFLQILVRPSVGGSRMSCRVSRGSEKGHWRKNEGIFYSGEMTSRSYQNM